MLIRENHPLKDLHTFGFDVYARRFTEITRKEEVPEVFAEPALQNNKHLLIGGGSNLVFSGDYDGMIIKLSNRGIDVIEDRSDHILVTAQAGEPWDDFVAFCVDQGWGGLENLSMIPGQTGTSPVQNIGAYGVELKDHFYSLEAFQKKSGKIRSFSEKDCLFGYRDSYFKQEGKDQYVILSVTFRLQKNPEISVNYGRLKEEVSKMGAPSPGIREVREAVCRIRQNKLPDPDVTGNAGSFFKNPVVSLETYRKLKNKHKHIVAYPKGKDVKLAAGWLIEKAGWKGYRKGDAGVHQHQALVLVNHGKATGEEILELSNRIISSISKQFGVQLETEVNIV